MIDSVCDVDFLEPDGRPSFHGFQNRRADRSARCLEINQIQQVAFQLRFGVLNLFCGKQPIHRLKRGDPNFPDQPGDGRNHQDGKQEPTPGDSKSVADHPLVENDKD